MRCANPYTPGAGFMPAYLAGREKPLEDAENYLSSIQLGYPQQSVIYSGLRGVGKTVLLNAIESEAEEKDILFEHIEINENRNFIQQIANTAKKFIHKMSRKEAAKEAVRKATGLLRAFTVTYNPADSTFTAGMDGDIPEDISTGILTDDLTDLFVSMGRTALKSEDTIIFFIDEIQYMKINEAEALISAIHRCNQLRLPIMIFGAGLPKILKMLGEVKSYSERLFRFEEIGSLEKEDAKAAIVKPAEELKVSYNEDAVKEIINVTEGYPFFIQEYCKAIWERAEETIITVEDVYNSRPEFEKRLDQSFFKVRFERSTKKEKQFMFAMVKCGDLPCTISNVAAIMGKNVKSISPYRAQLIDKGLIYATAHAEVDFTVQQFDKYLIRINPELEI